MNASTAAADRGAGRYAEEGSAWYEEPRKRCYHLLPGQDEVQIELEDVGGAAWWKRILTTLFSQNGQQQLRFVARRRLASPTEHPVAVSSTFASPRWAADTRPEPTWAPEMSASLAELRGDLERAGWRPEGRGTQPWSYRYVGPAVDWTREYVGRTGPGGHR